MIKRIVSLVLMFGIITSCFVAVAENSTWNKYNFVDKFGDPKDEFYIAGSDFTGSFKNSIGDNLLLTGYLACMKVEEEYAKKIFYYRDATEDLKLVMIYLFEYDNYQVKEGAYRVTIKTEDGDIYNYRAAMIDVYNCFMLYNKDGFGSEQLQVPVLNEFTDLMLSGKKLKVVMEEITYSSYSNRTIYRFVIDPTGFAELYNEL